MTQVIKIPKNSDDYFLADLTEKTFMKNVIINFKDGHSDKYFILDTASHWDDTESGKDEIVYMTDHDKDPDGYDRYAGNGISIDKIKSIEILD
ncbi:hypothetical protein J2Z60_000328 [Lactobacillus colini]|uniref:Uncharacterized protein n=1 Tax=Lactobacillus colini TaxID=1819254 RepID=A0ABS4MCW2_9LACO|nr:hypothetical protein [Lactobacillus colini]MBP2057166.1 hypothetical protein [Lactobacillus colini]